MTERLYKISADVDLEIRATSKKEAIEKAKNALQFLDIISFRVLPEKDAPQNNSLPYTFEQLSKNVWKRN